MLDDGNIYHVIPTKDRLVILHLANLKKASHIRIIDNLLFRLSSSEGGGRIYQINENEISLKEIGGQFLNSVYYGPIVDSAYIKNSYEEKIVAICGQNPSMVRKFTKSLPILSHKIEKIDPLCKNFWLFEISHENSMLIFSFINETKVLYKVKDSQEFSEKTEQEIQIISDKMSLMFEIYKNKDILLQITENEICVISLKSGKFTDTINFSQISAFYANSDTKFASIFDYSKAKLSVFNIDTNKKLEQIYEMYSENEIKSIIIKNNELFIITDFEIMKKNLANQEENFIKMLIPFEFQQICGNSAVYRNENLFLGTKNGHILNIDIKNCEILQNYKISNYPIQINKFSISCKNEHTFSLYANTESQLFCLIFAKEKPAQIYTIHTINPVRDFLIKMHENNIIYLDILGNLYNSRISQEKTLISKSVFSCDKNFVRVLYYPEQTVFYLITDDSEKPIFYIFDKDFYTLISKYEFTESPGKIKESFIQKFEHENSDFLILLTNSMNPLDETKGLFTLYKIDHENPAIFEKNSNAMFPGNITSCSFYYPNYFIVGCENNLYILEVTFSHIRAKLNVLCTRKLKDIVF